MAFKLRANGAKLGVDSDWMLKALHHDSGETLKQVAWKVVGPTPEDF